MSGIALVLPNADFSVNNIGQIEFTETNEEIAARLAAVYATRAGISDSVQKGAVETMILSLLDAGLWDKTKLLYPMLGSTVASMVINLKDSTLPLRQLANASVDGVNLAFSNTISVGALTPTWIYNSGTEVAALLRLKRNTGSINTSTLLSTNAGNFSTLYSSGGQRVFIFGFRSSAQIECSVVSTSVHNYAFHSSYTNNEVTLYVDGTKDGTNSVSTPSAFTIPDIIGSSRLGDGGTAGATLAQASSSLFDGTVGYYCIGEYTESEMLTVNTILSTFASTCGK